MAMRRFKKKAPRRPASNKVSKPLKTAIARVLRSVHPVETKYVTCWNGQQSSNQQYGVSFNSGIGTGTNYKLIPEIIQGSNVGDRIGDKINPKRLVVDFWVTAANLANNLDFVARLLVLSSRSVKENASIGSISMNELLDYGQGQKPFDGYTNDLSMPINKQLFTVHSDRLVTMDKTYGFNPAFFNSYSSSAQGQSPNLIHHYRVVIKCPKTLHYDGTLAVYPSGFAPFFNCGYAQPSRSNGLDTPDTTVQALSVQWSSTLWYTDA